MWSEHVSSPLYRPWCDGRKILGYDENKTWRIDSKCVWTSRFCGVHETLTYTRVGRQPVLGVGRCVGASLLRAIGTTLSFYPKRKRAGEFVTRWGSIFTAALQLTCLNGVFSLSLHRLNQSTARARIEPGNVWSNRLAVRFLFVEANGSLLSLSLDLPGS